MQMVCPEISGMILVVHRVRDMLDAFIKVIQITKCKIPP